MFDFSPNEEQQALVKSVARFVKEKIIPIAPECDRTSSFPSGCL